MSGRAQRAIQSSPPVSRGSEVVSGGPPPTNICRRRTRPPARSRSAPLSCPPLRLCNSVGRRAAHKGPHGRDGTTPTIHRPATSRHSIGQVGGHEASETLTVRFSDEHVRSHPTRLAMTHWDRIQSRDTNRLLCQPAPMDNNFWSALKRVSSTRHTTGTDTDSLRVVKFHKMPHIIKETGPSQFLPMCRTIRDLLHFIESAPEKPRQPGALGARAPKWRPLRAQKAPGLSASGHTQQR